MATRIPPLAQLLFFMFLVWGLARIAPALSIQSRALVWGGIFIVGIGLIFLTISVTAFLRAHTTVNPVNPQQTETLVTTGLYRISRNPMYLGMLLLLLGTTCVAQNIASLLVPFLFVFFITVLQIKPEERALQAKFGDVYKQYRRNVRRWI